MTIEDKNFNCKIIVIDTDAYAGNFERELCAYLTGQIGDCNVGSEFLKPQNMIKHLEWWENNISPQEDTEGSEFYRPCTIWKTGETNFYGSVAIFVEEIPPQEVLDEMIKEAKIFCRDTDFVYRYYAANKNPNIPKEINVLGYSVLDSEYTKVVIETNNMKAILNKKF